MTAIASSATAGASSPDATTANNTPYTFEEKRQRIFAIFAASSGNLVEWFDFYVYAFCGASTSRRRSFPSPTPPPSC